MTAVPFRASTLIALMFTTACRGAPARLRAGATDSVVVNNTQPVRLPMRVLDAAGHTLDSTGVRYAWASGASIPVTSAGVVTCTRAGDAVIRATLGDVGTNVVVRCRPVSRLEAVRRVEMVPGESAQELPIAAFDTLGRPVTLLAGTLKVHDTTVATLEGLRVHARAAGETFVDARFGDRATSVMVLVYERANSLEGIRPGQNLAVPVRLAAGETRRLQLAAGSYVLAMRDTPGDRPRLAIVGAYCEPLAWQPAFFCSSQGDATAIVYNPWRPKAAPEVRGDLTVRRIPGS